MTRIAINKAYWGALMTSAELDEALWAAAEKVAERASAATPPTGKQYRNADYIPMVVERMGDSSAYHVGVVVAGNPRSDWYARNKGTLT